MRTHPSDKHGARDGALRLALRIVLAAALLFFPAGLSFGGPGPSRILAGISLGGLFPAGAFNDHVRQDGFEVGFYLAKRAGNTPVFIGFELSGSFYGYAHRHESMVGIPEVKLDVETFNNICQGLLFVRLELRRGTAHPYIEGLAGVSYLYTDTTISSHEFPWDYISSDVNFDDFTVTAGAGVGLSMPLRSRPTQDPARRQKETSFDFKVRYMAGGRASYLKEGSIVVDGDEFTYTPERSATDFFTVQAAFSWYF